MPTVHLYCKQMSESLFPLSQVKRLAVNYSKTGLRQLKAID